MLCRSTNPLGKTLDYFQEDLDAMTKEMAQWKDEKKQYEVGLEKEIKATEQALSPLENMLKAVEDNISEQVGRIALTFDSAKF
jgi:TRAF3-interacting protein 1